MRAENLRARVCGVGLVAPGIPDWETGRLVLTGQRPWESTPLAIPASGFLPAAERRRAGQVIRLALECGHQAIVDSGRPAREIASVFASADVDAENTHQICLALNEAEPSLSPTRFHNSVQNAVSGYWTILTGSRAPTTMVVGGDAVLALGLLEAMTQAATSSAPVLLVVFDVPMPAPLFATHPTAGGGALALVLEAGVGQGPTIRVRLVRASAGESHVGIDTDRGGGADPLPDGLDGLRGVHPVGAALPMLARLARLAGRGAPTARRGPAVDRSSRLPGDDPAASGRSWWPFDRYHSLQMTIE